MKRKAKQTGIGAIFAALIGIILLAAMPTEAEARIYDDTLRLHILAKTDGEEDQAHKLFLRDRLLEKYGAALSAAADKAEAEKITEAALPQIEEDCRAWLAEIGCCDEVRALLSTEWYDTREYDGFVLPKGRYRSLRIMIGEGAGRNWWCVMYPPLCLDMATDAPKDDGRGYSVAETKLIRGEYRVKFKVLEVFSDLFAQKG